MQLMCVHVSMYTHVSSVTNDVGVLLGDGDDATV